jgi:gliding motility-associated-like protein
MPIIGCDSITVTFNNTSTNSTFYTWSFGDSTFSTTTNPTHTYSDTGTYTVMLIANASCSIHADTSTMTITVHPSPAPAIIGDSVFCIGTTSILNAGSFATYNWSTGSTTQTVTVDSANIYTVTVTNASGCTGTAVKTIIVNSNPTPTIAGGDSVCAGDSLMIYTVFYSHYLWNNGDTTSINYISAAGTYIVTVTDSHGCTAIDSITISVNPLPIPVITASGSITFCIGGSVILTSTPYATYHWNNGASTQTITVNTSGNYIVTVTTPFGCTGTTSDSVTVIPLPIVSSSFHADTTKGCTPLTINFINTSNNGTSYLWRFGDGDTSTTMNPIHIYTDSGTYSITLITTNSGPCGTEIDSVTLVDYIQVNVFHPIAAFTSNYVTPIYTGDSIHFQDQSYDLYGTITLWQWWFGDGKGTNFINPIHEWNLPGLYQVELIVTNKEGCKDSTIFDYIDVIEGIIEIPNTFTPNNDGYNDFFAINASGIESFQLKIFNRWGMKLFTSNSINIMWDGYNQSGLQCPDGTYYYILKATGYTGTAYNRAGFVMLLR